MIEVLQGDCRAVLAGLPDASAHCCVTSPPYWGLRDYGGEAQLGLEETPEQYVEEMVGVFREVRRVLRDDGTLWLNLGDSYNNRTKIRTSSHQPALNKFVDDRWADRSKRGGCRMSLGGGIKEKDLIGIPWRVAFALQADGWYLRSDIIWAKPNPMPESVKDRPTKAHEYVFLLSKSERYYYDAEAIAETFADARMGNPGAYRWTYANGEDGRGIRGRGGPSTKLQQEGWNADGSKTARNARTVWTISTRPFPEAHFAVFPEALARRCILAGCPEGGTVLDPFGGSGTVGLVAKKLGNSAVLVEQNPDYCAMARRRIGSVSETLFGGEAA